MNWFRSRHKKAFTLIELLVVIAIIALLAAILAPAVTKALLRGQVTQTMSNGRNLFVLLFSKDLDNPLQLQTVSGGAAWPKEGEYDSSTKYFATLVTNASFNLSYNFFAATGVRAASTELEFLSATELRNVWCIVQGVGGNFKASSPVLFTQNIKLTNEEIDKFDKLNEKSRPYGTRAAVVVGYGGSALSLDSDTAIATNFNPVGTMGVAIYPMVAGQLED